MTAPAAGAVELTALREQMSQPPALETLCTLFELSPFERDLLLLSAGPELDGSFSALCASVQDHAQPQQPTFGLALATLADAHWSALTPDAALRRWRLVEIGGGSSLMTSALRIDERVLHFLAGVSHLDEHLVGFVQRETAADELAPSQHDVADDAARTWQEADASAALPVLQLCGEDDAAMRAVAAQICATLGLSLFTLPTQALPVTPHELETLMRLWEREAALSGGALLLDCAPPETGEAARDFAARRFVDEVGGALLLASRERRPAQRRSLVTFDVAKPRPEEQATLWRSALGPAAFVLNGHIERLTAQFDLSAPLIRTAADQALLGWPEDDALSVDAVAAAGARLWDACRTQARPKLDNLARRIEPAASWDDLVLPPGQRAILYETAAHVRQRAKVYETWGFAAKSSRGLGISALFSGPSGTGKTMAAEVLANELQLDLYHIDLSQVVSKYIGETEKNLRRVFDAAEEGGAILFFDEADALFGKRSEVRDSHDRYANIEVSYLLQRMEAYRGLAILTTNMKKALDTAFLRRIRFIVHFPFPNVAARAEIWQRIFPVATPTEGLEPHKLARLNVAGGNIRNIALNAAFLAADAGEPVRMAHLLEAARTEYAKLEKSLTSAEINGWA